MKLIYKEIEYKKLGKCLEISNGYLTLIATLDIGPRIISFTQKNDKNIFFEDINNTVTEQGTFFDETYGKGTMWKIYGGHRLWSSPQNMQSYYPDNDPIRYQATNHSVLLIQDVQKSTNLQLEMEISFTEKNQVKVHHKITNTDAKEKTLSPWALTVLEKNGLEIVPLPKEQTGLVPQRFISVWDFGAKANDERLYFGDKFFTMKHDTLKNIPIKIGLKVSDNWAAYLVQGQLFIKRFKYDSTYVYPDNNVNFETYENNLFLELETLGELKTLGKGDSVEHTEYWSLYVVDSEISNNKDEEMISEIMKKYL